MGQMGLAQHANLIGMDKVDQQTCYSTAKLDDSNENGC